MDNTRKTLKENIKKYRNYLKRSGIGYCKSATKFSQFVGIEASTYKKYESINTDIVPPYENLIKIAKALCVSIDKLLDYVPPDKHESFLRDLGILYEKEASGNYVLSYPFKSIHVIQIEYNDLGKIIKLWQFLKLKDRSIFEKQFIFMNLAAEWSNPNMDTNDKTDKAMKLIEQMEKLKEWREKSEKEKENWRNELKKAVKGSNYLSKFRGGKL